eukprot:164874-Karenia_brevis.AAC.1
MRNLEDQFSDLRIHVDKEISNLRSEQESIKESLQIAEANHDNLHAQVSDQAASVDKLTSDMGK